MAKKRNLKRQLAAAYEAQNDLIVHLMEYAEDLDALEADADTILACHEIRIEDLERKLRQEHADSETWYHNWVERDNQLCERNTELRKAKERILELERQVSTTQHAATVHMKDAQEYALKFKEANERANALTDALTSANDTTEAWRKKYTALVGDKGEVGSWK